MSVRSSDVSSRDASSGDASPGDARVFEPTLPHVKAACRARAPLPRPHADGMLSR
jgi:hypothetical protein